MQIPPSDYHHLVLVLLWKYRDTIYTLSWIIWESSKYRLWISWALVWITKISQIQKENTSIHTSYLLWLTFGIFRGAILVHVYLTHYGVESAKPFFYQHFFKGWEDKIGNLLDFHFSGWHLYNIHCLPGPCR